MTLPTIKWKCNSDDDFVGVCEGWMLRVEQMDDDFWWWCLYRPDDSDAEFDYPIAHTMNEAIDYAVTSFYFHHTPQSEKLTTV